VIETTAAEVKAKLDRGEKVRFLDVREPHEIAICRLEGAEHIPMMQLFLGLKAPAAAPDSATTVRISFYFEAKAPGAHEFTAQHGENELRVVVGGKQLVDLKAPGEGGGKGVVHLEGGFHRIDVLLRYEADPSFSVSVLSPGAAESRVVKRSDLLLKRPAE
jgi:hypothetical protein